MRLGLRKLAPITTAALLVLAIMVAPLCNTLCASPASCHARSSAAESTSDACHHVTVSTESDDSLPALRSGAICAQPEIPMIVADTDPTQTTQRLDRISALLNSPLIDASFNRIQTRAKDAVLSDSGGAPASSDPRLRTTILQI
jgi:hypothetical protein